MGACITANRMIHSVYFLYKFFKRIFVVFTVFKKVQNDLAFLRMF